MIPLVEQKKVIEKLLLYLLAYAIAFQGQTQQFSEI